MNIRSKIFGGGDAAEETPIIAAKKPKGAKTDALNSIAVSREEHRRGNTRAADRHRLSDEPVCVTYAGNAHAVELINLSGGGAMVSGDFEPKLWDKLDLHLGEDGVIECAVRWLKGDRIGLEFAHETRLDCSADQQAELLRAVLSNNLLGFAFDAPTGPSAAVQSGDDQRVADRHPLIWSGTLHYDFHSAAVRLRNISSTGALVEFEVPLPVGAEPLLELGAAGSIFATVTWVVGDQAGLRFHEPFDLARLADARPQVTPASWQPPAYLGSSSASKPGSDADGPWAEEWGRMSLNELRDELEGFMKR